MLLRLPFRRWRVRVWVTAVAAALIQILVVSCCPFGEQVDVIAVRGAVVDSVTLDVLGGIPAAAVTIKNGEVDLGSRLPSLRPIGDDGMFRVIITKFGPPFCATPFGPRLPAPVFPEPDQFEIIIFRDDCEQSFFIDVNDDTVVVLPPDADFAHPTFELREPLLVDPCVPDASP